MEETCKTCEYYIQHYCKPGRSYQELGIGHCMYGRRIKQTKPNHAACGQYMQRRCRTKRTPGV